MEIIKLDKTSPDQGHLKKAAECIRRGGLVVFPTETVYGIGANFNNPQALARLYAIKKRPGDKPFTLHIVDKEALANLDILQTGMAQRLIDKFWPGPLTIIFRRRGEDTLGIRMPACRIAQELIRCAGVPVVAPSANISGVPPATTADEAARSLDGLVDIILDAGPTKYGMESTIVDLTHLPARIIREGAIPKEELAPYLAIKRVLFVCTGNTCRSVMAEALLRARCPALEVASAGIAALNGMAATEHTLIVLKEKGLDASLHRTRQIEEKLLEGADLVFVMTSTQRDFILKNFPSSSGALCLLKRYGLGDEGRDIIDADIPDPIGQPIEVYKETLKVIEEAIERVAKALCKEQL